MHLNIWITGLFVLNALLSIKPVQFEKDLRVLPVYAGIMLLFLIHLISILYSDNFSVGLKAIETKLGLLLIPLAFYLGLNKLSIHQMDLAKRAFILSMLIAVFSCYVESIYQAIVHSSPSSLLGSRLSNHLMHRGYFSSYIIFALVLWWEDENFLPKLRKLAIVLFAITLVLLQGRVNIFAICLVTTGYFLLIEFRKASPGKLVVFASSIILAILFFVNAPYDYNRFDEPMKFSFELTDREEDFTGLTYRLAIWENATQVAFEKFWSGYGIGDSQDALKEQYAVKDFKVAVRRNPNCHNQFLELVLAVGILGPILFGLILSYMLLRSIRIRAPFLTMIIISFSLTLLTESVLNRYQGVVMLSLLILFCYKSALMANRTEAR